RLSSRPRTDQSVRNGASGSQRVSTTTGVHGARLRSEGCEQSKRHRLFGPGGVTVDEQEMPELDVQRRPNLLVREIPFAQAIGVENTAIETLLREKNFPGDVDQ